MRLAFALAGAALGLSACADDMYGPYGYGYGGYGYGGYGYPYGYGYGGYYGGYYGAYDPFGWYGDYYYPGVGFYVYDSYHHPYRWTGDQQRYWTTRRSNWQGRTGTTWTHENWSGFNRPGTMTGGHSHHPR
jgi:hypothetical protein